MLVLLIALACGGGDTTPTAGSSTPANGQDAAGTPPSGAGNNSNQGQTPSGKTPPSFMYNIQSKDKGIMYKAEDGSCFVRTNHDQHIEGEMGPVETVECPTQMSHEGWKNCIAGRLVKHNEGEKEGTCECQRVESKEPLTVDCL